MIRFSASHHPHPQVHPAQDPSENHEQRTTRTSQGLPEPIEAEHPLTNPSTPTPPSREEGHGLPELRPPDAVGSYADGVSHHQHQADVDVGVLEALPRQPLIG